MAWFYLILGGIFEIGWPLGFKLADVTHHKVLFIAVAVVSMALSGMFLFIAQKSIPIGTAYAVWTGIGAVGTLAIGIVFFKDPATFARLFSAFLIVAGIIGLKLFEPTLPR
ncbi:MAG: multidrug efflux SMR transporter [Alistipes sp.]|nr:multidrug efflux SMR transporter [Alistipes sp.]